MDVLNVALISMSLSTLVMTIGSLYFTRRRHKKHEIHMVWLRMQRMDPVVFIKRKKRSKWVAVGTHDLLGEIGSNMSWHQEGNKLADYFDERMGKVNTRLAQIPSAKRAGTKP